MLENLESLFVLNFLAFVRVGTFFTLAPVFTFIRLPVTIRVLFSVAMAMFLLAAAQVPTPVLSGVSWPVAIIAEVINGSAMAFGMAVAFAVFHFSGRILDFQLGFGIAGLIDPATQTQAPLTGTLLHLLAVIVFVLSGGVVLIFKTLVLSFNAAPPGQMLSLHTVELFILHFGLLFSLSLALVAPVLLAIFLLDLLMAFAGRTMPQMNVFIISIPFKIAIGMVVLAVTVVAMQPLFRRVFESFFQFWELLLHG